MGKDRREIIRDEKHPLEHKLAGYYHRMSLIRTIAPILMLCIQTVVLVIQLAIASKIFNIPIADMLHITQLIQFIKDFS